MSKMISLLLAASLPVLTLSPGTVHADSVWGEFDTLNDEEIPGGEEKDTFAGKFQLGYLASSGNTESASFNGKLAMGWDLEDWRHAVVASGFSSESDGVTDGENYQAGYKADRKLGEKNYLFAAVNWEADRFSGIDKRTSEAVGYGRRFLETDTHLLDLEFGVGARQTELEDGTERDEIIGRFAGNYKWQIAETSSFEQKLAVESGDENTYSESVTSLTSQLVGKLDLSVSYTIKRNSDVPLGREETDTYTTINIVYSF